MSVSIKIVLTGWLMIIVVAFSLSMGCIKDQYGPNAESTFASGKTPGTLPDIYTSPIGGFETKNIRLNSDTKYSLNYTFFSRDWEGGTVDYQLYHDGQNFSTSDPFNATISPSSFTALPHQAYPSRVTINTGTKFQKNTYLTLVVRLQSDKKHYANDSMLIMSDKDLIPPGLGILSIDSMRIENQTLTVRRGDTQRINVTFIHGRNGLANISYSISDTPLQVTIIPSSFIATYNVNVFPSIISVSAGPYTLPGRYTFSLEISGYNYLPTSRYDFAVDVPLS